MKQRICFLFVACVMFLNVARAQMSYFIPSERFSSSLISCICQDNQGSLWIATDYGLNRFDGYAFQTYLHEENDSTSLQANVVVSLLCDHDGSLWVGTNRGLDCFDYATESFRHYIFPDGLHPRVSSLLLTRDGSLLVGTAGYGAFTVDANDKVVPYSLPVANSYFSRFFEDSRGRLWRSGFDGVISMREGDKLSDFISQKGIPLGFVELDDCLLIACQHGLMSYSNGRMSVANIDMGVVAGKAVNFSTVTANSQGDIYIGSRGQGLYRISSARPRRLEQVNISAIGIDANTAKLRAATFDREGNLWMACESKGLLLLPQRPEQFSSWSFEAQGIRHGSTVSSVCEGDNGIIWSTVQGVGVYGFNRQGRVVAHPSSPEAVEFIFRDRQHRYWLGTDDGLYSYDPLSGHAELKVTFDCDKFNDMTSDDSGNIYISSFSRGFCIYNPQTGKLLNHSFYDADTDTVRGRLCNNWVMGMSVDQQGLLWLATSSGVACYAPSSDSFRSQGWESLLNGVVCFDVCELHSGKLADGRHLNSCVAIGTEQGLYLYDRQTHHVERFPASEQLSNKAVCYLVQSNDGDLWCSTSEGIWRYSQEDQAFVSYVGGNGLMQREYIYGVGLHTDSDVIYFGQNDGLTVFSPKNIREDEVALAPLQLSSFRAGDQYVNTRTVINGVHVTDHAVGESNYFTLSYLDHTVTLAFSQYLFDNPANLTLEYRVNGGQWISNPKGKNDFTLGHLQPGTYRIEARAGHLGEYTPEKVVVLTIRAPWYRSTLAYILYAIILVALVALWGRNYRRRANEQLNEEKMKFLINATHDIRSPLTIILSALKKLRSGDNEKSGVAAVETIEHNSKRILDLVNQILDVRKIDKQQLHLHCQQTDIVQFTQSICKMFEYNAKERNIQFHFLHDNLEHLDAWIDRTQFDKVITNLLSNAFKFVYDNGDVTVRLSVEGTVPANGSQPSVTDAQSFRLQVSDDGVGLDSDSLKHIFDRFYQGTNSRRMHVEGTGIGLNLCKMIVDMHRGTIEAHNRTDSKGAVFSVCLPLGNAHLKPEEIEYAHTVPTSPSTTVSLSGQPAASGSSRHRVLIVDDDLEIGHYISSELGRYYKFGICSNGKEGLKELLTNEYDLVVSDVMMPEMDGFTMLRLIKTNLNLSHLPVVMLTSKADVANRLEGLERGADAFLAKPFDMEELHMVISNLIQNRQHLKGKFSGAQQQADKLEQPEVKGNDEQLMERIMKVVNKNLGDSDFNVEMLCSEVGISRTQLHRKMKELTGLSTSEFIRNIRLEQAARLLKEQKINVTQVAYTVGFSNLAHFSTVFRKHFGVAPSDYVAGTKS